MAHRPAHSRAHHHQEASVYMVEELTVADAPSTHVMYLPITLQGRERETERETK